MSEALKSFEKSLLQPVSSFICLNCNTTLNIASFNTFEKTCEHENCLERFAFEDINNLEKLKKFLQLFINKIHNLLILLPKIIENPEERLETNHYFFKKEQTYSNLIMKSSFTKKDIKKIFDFYITYFQIFKKTTKTYLNAI